MPENTNNTNYFGYPIVKARILAQKASWLIVRTADGRRGIIPKREWTWSRGRGQTYPQFKEGDSIAAVLLPSSFKSGYAHLSLRELANPWKNAAQAFKTGDVLRCEVVNLRSRAAFVEILECFENGQYLPVTSGITAVLWAGDLPLLADQVPADVLSVGDRFFAVVTRLEPERKRMWVSVNAWIQGLDMSESAQEKHLETVFRPFLDQLTFEETGQAPLDTHKTKEFKVAPLTQLRKLLIIDDNAKDREHLIRHLRRAFNMEILETDMGKKGLELLETHGDIDLVILDIGLGSEEHGPDIGKKILEKFPSLHLIFSSSNHSHIEKLFDLEHKMQRIFPFIHKKVQVSGNTYVNDESVSETVHLLFEGTVHRISYGTATGNDRFMEQMGFATQAKSAPDVKILELLSLLSRTCLIEHTIVLKLDVHKKEATLIAGSPEEDTHLYKASLDGIYYSPVKEVIEDQEILYGNHIGPEAKTGRFKNFFRYLNFNTCYGVHIPLSIGDAHYGLFVLDRSKDLSWDSIMRIRITASQIAMILEHGKMIEALSRYQERSFMGEMFGTFVHELKNSFEAMDGDLELLEYRVSQQDKEGALKKVEKLRDDYNTFKNLTNAYTRYVTEGGSHIQVNDLVKKALQQLQHKAQKENYVTIRFSPDENLPLIWGNALHIEQIVLNVTLNAIQHVSAQYRKMQEVATSRGTEKTFTSSRRIWVKTCLDRGGKFCQIAVADSGPGIAFDLSERIFQMGISTRGDGHGLGLFISRNLVESMNGRIFLAESIRYAGSLFVIHFPIYNSN